MSDHIEAQEADCDQPHERADPGEDRRQNPVSDKPHVAVPSSCNPPRKVMEDRRDAQRAAVPGAGQQALCCCSEIVARSILLWEHANGGISVNLARLREPLMRQRALIRFSEIVLGILLTSGGALAQHYSPPIWDGRYIDGCIGRSCDEDSQRRIAEEFCNLKGHKFAEKWETKDTRRAHRSYKLNENYTRWNREEASGVVFTYITCKGDWQEMVLTTPTERPPQEPETSDSDVKSKTIEIGEIQSRCLFVWDDPPHVHKVEQKLSLTHQSTSVQMKKLRHCIKLRVVGPVDIEGLARSHIDQCVNYALNHRKVQHALELLVAIGVDVFAGGGGTASATKLSLYVKSVAEETVDCLTDVDRLMAHFKEDLKTKFKASVKDEQHWIYWWL